MHTRGVLAHLDIIERVTGHRPPTCPWRAFYHPLVVEVLEVVWSAPEGNLAGVIGDDPPMLLVQAVGAFLRAREATRAEERLIAKKQRDAAASAAKHRPKV